LKGSEILRIATEIRARLAAGERICNLTVGDFDPRQFRVPKLLEDGTIEALRRGETNYPPGVGMPVLRESVRRFYENALGLTYPLESILVTTGSRPGVYGTYRTLVGEGDGVIYGVPSWNNNYYTHMMGARALQLECGASDAFLPTRERLEPMIRGARLLALNSPLNPTGTAFTADSLGAICDLVLEENARRSAAEGPLYVMYDHVYWQLTFGSVEHVNPVSLRPEIAPYTILVDGISKAFAATGMRVGWVVGPAPAIKIMENVLTHVGTWAPRAEPIASPRSGNRSWPVSSSASSCCFPPSSSSGRPATRLTPSSRWVRFTSARGSTWSVGRRETARGCRRPMMCASGCWRKPAWRSCRSMPLDHRPMRGGSGCRSERFR
jgi:aspartate aminotransferase